MAVERGGEDCCNWPVICCIMQYAPVKILIMNFRLSSLRQKVTFGYLAGGIVILALAGLNWKNFNSLERMVISGGKVSDFFDTALEIRRFEKNFFLYGQRTDYEILISYVDKAEQLLHDNPRELDIFAGAGSLRELEKDIREYRALLKDLPSTDTQEKLAWEKSLRDKGKAIVTQAETLSDSERKLMRQTFRKSTSMIMFSMFFLVVLGFITGGIFYRMFIKPLRILEQHMMRLSEGNYSYIPVWSRDRELISLTKAFNRMLNELEWRQQHIVQSEKLASFGTLLFGVAHDLNNPLSNISTSCQILREELEEADPGYKRELLGQIEEETDRAKDIVRSLLEFSKAGKREIINLSSTVKDSIRFIRNELPPKLEIKLGVPEEITVFADRQQLQQVFLNMIKNAGDAISGDGVLSISARKSGDHVEIVLADTGAGMEPEMLSKIFDPFFTTKSSKKGYGLGLFIVHKIIEEHEGSIDVSSYPGKGTTFLIKLPSKETGAV